MKKKNTKKLRKSPLEVKRSENITQYMVVDVEIKSLHDENDGFFRFEGLASTFGNTDLVDDIVAKGAFKESLLEKSPIILWQHDMFEPIGVPEEVRETSKGLFVRAKLPKSDTLVSGRVIPQIEVGSIRKMSIGFRTKESSFDETTGIRTLIKLDLREISLVTFPANPEAEITGFKGGFERIDTEKAKEITTKRQFEECLRESGIFTKNAACIMAKHFQGEPVVSDEQKKEKLICDELTLLLEELESFKTENELNLMKKLLENNHGTS